MSIGSSLEDLPCTAPSTIEDQDQNLPIIGDIRTLTAQQVLCHLDAIAEQTAGGTVNLMSVLEKYGLPRALFFELVGKRRRLELALDQYIGMDRRGQVILVSSPHTQQRIATRRPLPPQENMDRTPKAERAEHPTREITAEQALALVDRRKDLYRVAQKEWREALESAGITIKLFLQLCQFRDRLQIAARHGLPIFRNGRLNLSLTDPPLPRVAMPKHRRKALTPSPPPSVTSQSPPPRPPQTACSDPALKKPRKNRCATEQWQIYAAVCHISKTLRLSFLAACSFLRIPHSLFHTYRKKFRGVHPSPESIERGIAFVRQQIGDDIPAALERLRLLSGNGDHAAESPEQTEEQEDPPEPEEPDSETVEVAPPGFRPKNIFEAIKYGQFDFVPWNADGYEPTCSPPGSAGKVDVMEGRAKRGNPSVFHPKDPRNRGGKPRWLELREAVEDGMRKQPTQAEATVQTAGEAKTPPPFD